MDQYYKIAGLTVKMDSFGMTSRLAAPYSITPCINTDITITANLPDGGASGIGTAEDAYAYMLTGKEFYTSLIDHGGLMLHASAIAMDGKAYLFSADSGVGKSTHTALWQQTFGESVQIINDDKPALRWLHGLWYAFGTPWCGKHGLNQNVGYPVGGICLLSRGEENFIEPYTGSDLVFRLMKQTYRPTDARRSERLLSMLASLLEQVPVWHLQCNTQPQAAYMAWEAMTGKEKKEGPLA